MITMRRRARPSTSAALRPAGPPPTIATSYTSGSVSVLMRGSVDRSRCVGKGSLRFPGIGGSVGPMAHAAAIGDVLAAVGPRLRRLRERRELTLTAVAARTRISKSTLSRLESGQRKPSLELLLPLAESYRLPLDELVGATAVGDPRIRTRPRTRNGRLVYPLTQQSGGLDVWKVVIPPERERKLRTHVVYEWLYVLSGRL